MCWNWSRLIVNEIILPMYLVCIDPYHMIVYHVVFLLYHMIVYHVVFLLYLVQISINQSEA